MAKEKILVSASFSKDAKTIYNAWLDSEKHSEMTGASAEIQPVVGSEFSAWDEYISGKILELEPGKRILCAWRAADFPDGAEDSRLEVKFIDIANGSTVEIIHSDLPEGMGESFRKGWLDYYFEPMGEYFGTI